MVYFLFSLFCLLSCVYTYDKEQLIKNYFTFSLVLIFACIFGFRIPGLGSDTISYITIFESQETYRSLGFDMFVKTLSSLGVMSDYFIFILTFLVVSTITYAFYLFSKTNIVLTFFLFSTTYTIFSFSLNIMRQGIAVGFSLLVLFLIIRKKYLQAGIFLSIALIFHLSAIYIIPTLILVSMIGDKPLSKTNFLLLSCVYILFFVFSTTALIEVLVDNLLAGTSIRVTILGQIRFWNKGIVGPWFTLSSILPFVFVCSSFYVFRYLKVKPHAHFNMLLNYYFIGFISCSPFIYIHLMYSRLAWYFFILEPILLSLFFLSIFKEKLIKNETKVLVFTLVVFIAVIYLFKTYFITGGIMREIEYDQIIF